MKTKRRQTDRSLSLSLTLFILLLLVWGIKTLKQPPRPLVSEQNIFASLSSPPSSTLPPPSRSTPLSRPQVQVSNLKDDLVSYLVSRPAEWSVVLSQDDTQLLSLNGDQPLGAASVMKLVTALAGTKEIETRADLTAHTPVEGRSVEMWGELLINQSNNDAWDILRSYLGFQPEKELVETLGLEHTDIYQNTISASDANKLLQFIWSNSQKTALPILFWMYQTETETRIPQGVSEFFQDRHLYPPPVFHKAGSWFLTGIYNDVAIVPLSDQVLFLSIISEGDQTQAQGEETLREITKIVLKHLTSMG